MVVVEVNERIRSPSETRSNLPATQFAATRFSRRYENLSYVSLVKGDCFGNAAT